MDDGSQKLLDVIDDPSALESFLGLSAEGSDRATLESIVDSLQQGLLEVAGARHSSAAGGGGSLVLTQQQLHQLQQFQAQQLSQQSASATRQQAVTFSLPSHTIPSSVVTTIPSSGASTHHFVLAQFPHQTHPSTSSSSAQPHGFIYTPTSSAAPSSCASSNVLGSLPITSGLLAPNSAGIQIATGSSGLPAIPVSSAAIFGTSGIPLGPSGVLVGPPGAMFQPSALPITATTGSSPGSPFSVPTRSPAPHAPPTPSPSPLPLRSPAHPPSPTASPYHSQLQSPQNAGFIPMVQSQGSHHSSGNFVQFKDTFGSPPQQQSSQNSMVVLPHQRSGPSQSTSSSPQSPYQSPMSQPSPHCQSGSQLITGKGSAVRSPAPSTGGALTPAPSPSPQHRTAPSVSPVVRPATPQPSQSATVIHQALSTGLALPAGQQFPVVSQGGTAMLQAGNQLVQIIHHQPSSVAAPTFPSHTQIITSAGPGAPVHLQPTPVASITTTPNKPKQPPQILPKPPGSAGLTTQGGHGKMATSSRSSLAVSSQQQALHTQHHAPSGAQVVIGQANQAVMPAAQAGTLVLNQMIPGLTSGAPVLVQQNTNGSVQFILRPPTPGTQSPAHSAKNSAPQHGPPMLISGSQLVHNARAQQALQPQQQVLRLITTHGAPMQLQQIQTPSGPTIIAVPSGQTLSFQHLPQLATTAQPPPAPQHSHPPPPPPLPPPPPPLPPPPPIPQSRPFHVQAAPNNMLPTVLGRSTTCGHLSNTSGQSPHHHHHPQQLQQQQQQPQQQQQQSNGPLQDFPPMSHLGMARPQLSQLQQHQHQQHMMVLPSSLAPPKKKPKKKKKKKKDDDRKLDLANLIKLSGIDDEDGITLYDCEEPGNQQIVDGASPTSGGEQNSSDMITGQHGTQVPLQGGTQTAFKFSVEDGKVVFQPENQGLTPSQANSASLLLQNIMSQGQSGVSQQSLAEAHNQLSNLLTRTTSTSNPGSASQVVLSQLLQNATSSTPQLVSTGTNTTSRACGTNSPTSLGSPNFAAVSHSSDRFSSLPPTPKTCSPTLTRDAFTEIQHSPQSTKGMDGSVVTFPVYSMPSKSQGASLRNSFTNLSLSQPLNVSKYTDASCTGNVLSSRDHSISTCSSSVHNTVKTVATNCSTPMVMGSSDHSSNVTLSRSTSLPCSLPTHLHSSTAPTSQKSSTTVTSCTSTLSSLRATILQGDTNKAACGDVGHLNKQSSYAHSAQTSDRPVVLGNSTTQTENLQDGNKVCDSFLSPTSLTTKTTCSSAEPTPSFLGLQSFPNLQSLVSSGGTMPLIPTTTSSMTYTGTEQLVIAHPGGLSSVIATPQLLQCLQQAQGHGLVNMPPLQLAPNILNKATGNAGLAFGSGTIVIGGPAPDTFNSPPAQNKTLPVSSNTTKTVPQQSVLLQQLNCSQRRSSSDSNSSLSLGSPPPIVSMVSQGVGTQSHRKISQSHQSIETQTVAVGTATTTANMGASLPSTFLDNLSQTHPNLVVNTKVGGKPVLNVTNMNAAASLNKKLKKPKRNERVLPVKIPQAGTSCVNSLCVNVANSSTMTVNQQRMYAPNSSQAGVDTTKVALQERILSKAVATSQHNVTVSCSTSLPFVVTSPQYTAASNKTVVTTCMSTLSSSTQSPHPSIVCNTNSSNGTPIVSSPSHLGKLLPGQQIARSIATQVHSSLPGDFPSSHHVVVSSLPSTSSPSHGNTIITTIANTTSKTSVTNSSSGIPHLVPFPQTSGSGSSSGGLLPSNSIIQKVHTIQLTPQNQKHLKAVQMQIEVLQSRKQLLSSEQESLQRLYDEQKRILATGKVVPTIPGQHAQGLHFNSSLEHSGDQRKSPATTTATPASTYLANLLRQPASHQNAQVTGTVRYQHQIGNQVITFPPSNQQKSSHLSNSHSVYRATSHGTQTTDSPPAVPHGDPPSSSHQHTAHTTEAGEMPRVAVVSPAVQLSKSQSPVVTMCEKGTSPIQVQQVGTQTTPLSELSPRIAQTSKLVPCSSPGEVAKSPGLPSPQLKPQCTGLPKLTPNNIAKVVPTTQGLPTPTPGPAQVISPVSPPVRAAQKPTTSPARPTISRSDLIEQQLKTDKNGALMPDTETAFTGTSDACKRLIRYHVFNEQVLSQQDLEKADEIFEATAKHLLDKFRQMMNKYRYLLLMESTREVNTSELIMIDRMFVAEEHSILERLRQNEVKVKDELVTPSEAKPDSSAECDLKGTLADDGEQQRSIPDLKEVRVMVHDVMKNVSIKRELEEDQKFTIVKKELGGDEQRYDEWLEIQKELGVYGNINTPHVKVECGRNHAMPIQLEVVHNSGSDASMLGEDSMQRTRNCSPPSWDQGGTGRERPRDEGGGGDVSERTKRKEVCDIAESGASPFRHKKRRHKRSSSDEDDGTGCDEDDDINAQVQSAIDSILNLQRSEDGFELPGNGGSLAVPVPAEMDAEETQQHLFGSDCNSSPSLVVGVGGFAEDSGASSGNPEDDPVLDEAVRSILTS